MQHIKVRTKSVIYKFSNFEKLLEYVIKVANKSNFKNKLYLYNQQYFLEVAENITDFHNLTKVKSQYYKFYLEEYGKLISKNAIDEITKAFIDS